MNNQRRNCEIIFQTHYFEVWDPLSDHLGPRYKVARGLLERDLPIDGYVTVPDDVISPTG